MLAIVRLSMTAFSHRASLATLAWMARAYELVLVCPHHVAAPGLVSALRGCLSGRVVIAVLVDGAAHEQERELIDGVIRDGNIPLIVTTLGPGSRRGDGLGLRRHCVAAARRGTHPVAGRRVALTRQPRPAQSCRCWWGRCGRSCEDFR